MPGWDSDWLQEVCAVPGTMKVTQMHPSPTANCHHLSTWKRVWGGGGISVVMDQRSRVVSSSQREREDPGSRPTLEEIRLGLALTQLELGLGLGLGLELELELEIGLELALETELELEEEFVTTLTITTFWPTFIRPHGVPWSPRAPPAQPPVAAAPFSHLHSPSFTLNSDTISQGSQVTW